MYIVFAFCLFILNIILLIVFYFKLKKRFSDETSISAIKKEAAKLLADIAFQTDRSVTVMEEKFTVAKNLMAELENRILLVEKEEQNRARTRTVLQGLETGGFKEGESFRQQEMRERRGGTSGEDFGRSINGAGSSLNGMLSARISSAQAQDVKTAGGFKEGESFRQQEMRERRGGISGEDSIKIYTKRLLLNKAAEDRKKDRFFYEQIVEMAKKGLSIELIAEKVPLSAGEIELIVSLNT